MFKSTSCKIVHVACASFGLNLTGQVSGKIIKNVCLFGG